MKSCWFGTIPILLWCFSSSAGGHRLRKKHDGHLMAVGNLGYQWQLAQTLMGNPRTQVDQEWDRMAIRHLMSTNETTEAPSGGSKTVWEKIEEFYSDSNNMAMFCVLPIMVLVYGGCSAIYCIYKCRRYLRRRGKHKRLRNEDTSSLSGEEQNNLNQDGDKLIGGEDQPIKTVSGSAWEDNNAAFTDMYNVQRKKTPLPWDVPQNNNQIQRQDSFVQNETRRSREGNASAGSRDSTALALEREREKLERNSPRPVEERPKPVAVTNTGPTSAAKAADFSRFSGGKAIEIVPISQKEYQRHMESQDTVWDPLHNRPFDSRASGGDTDRRTGRDSSWSIRDEIMAKYDALTSLAMAKKTADVLRTSAHDPNMDTGHRPDTLRRKPGKKKLIFIAE